MRNIAISDGRWYTVKVLDGNAEPDQYSESGAQIYRRSAIVTLLSHSDCEVGEHCIFVDSQDPVENEQQLNDGTRWILCDFFGYSFWERVG